MRVTCGALWAAKGASSVAVSFQTYLYAGHLYMFRTHLVTHAIADAVGLVAAKAVVDVGGQDFNGGAWLTSISLNRAPSGGGGGGGWGPCGCVKKT